jgi:putative endonuclease
MTLRHATRRQTGDIGEQAAADYLLVEGYTVLARNYRTRIGEIDLIARRDAQVCFVEVKTRGPDHGIHPLQSVDATKQRRLVATARRFLGENSDLQGCSCRFDCMAVLLDEAGQPVLLRWYKNAFRELHTP